jgi:hypothetical protein
MTAETCSDRKRAQPKKLINTTILDKRAFYGFGLNIRKPSANHIPNPPHPSGLPEFMRIRIRMRMRMRLADCGRI